jgi:hypothetical protein
MEILGIVVNAIDITVHLWTPQPNGTPLPSLRFSAPATSLMLTSNVEGGCESARVGMAVMRNGEYTPAWLPNEFSDWRDLAHVVISDGAGALWVGELTQPHHQPGGIVGAFTATGYLGRLDREYYTQDEDAPNGAVMTTAQLIQHVLHETFPAIDTGDEFDWVTLGNGSQYADPGVEFTASDFDGMSVAQIINQAVKAGGTDGVQWDFQLWPGGSTGVTAWLRSRSRPELSLAEYRVPWDDSVTLSYDAREIVTHVRVRYSDVDDSGAETETEWYPTLADTSIQTRYGIPRNRREIQGGALSSAEANQYAQAIWGEYSRRRWSGTISRQGHGLDLSYGGLREGRRVRSGEWVHVEGIPEDEGPLLIHGTEWSSEGDSLTVQIGPGITDQDALIKHLRRTMAMLRQNRAPDTGARR